MTVWLTAGRHVQARAESLEAQVALTTAQVQNLQASQKQLQARNALLTSVADNLSSTTYEALVVSCCAATHTSLLLLPAANTKLISALSLSLVTTSCQTCHNS